MISKVTFAIAALVAALVLTFTWSRSRAADPSLTPAAPPSLPTVAQLEPAAVNDMQKILSDMADETLSCEGLRVVARSGKRVIVFNGSGIGWSDPATPFLISPENVRALLRGLVDSQVLTLTPQKPVAGEAHDGNTIAVTLSGATKVWTIPEKPVKSMADALPLLFAVETVSQPYQPVDSAEALKKLSSGDLPATSMQCTAMLQSPLDPSTHTSQPMMVSLEGARARIAGTQITRYREMDAAGSKIKIPEFSQIIEKVMTLDDIEVAEVARLLVATSFSTDRQAPLNFTTSDGSRTHRLSLEIRVLQTRAMLNGNFSEDQSETPADANLKNLFDKLTAISNRVAENGEPYQHERERRP